MRDFILNNWATLAAPFGFLVALAVKASFDFHCGYFVVKWFRWFPVRWLFQERIPSIGGSWSHVWLFDGDSHKNIEERHDNSDLYQLGPYVCCEHYASGVKYRFFGRIRGGYVSGLWFDEKSNLGYSGAFQLRVVTEKSLIGNWIGHSTKSNPGEINGNRWVWSRNG